MRTHLLATLSVALLAACADTPDPTSASSTVQSPEDAFVSDLVARMSLERKVAQLIQPQINSFTAEDMQTYRFGSYLNGGNGGPGGDEFAPAAEWLALADEMWDASTAPLPEDEPVIPAMWGTDAVHGHTNIVGATVFPHNIGLGATGDADLVRRIGHATAIEIEVTGIDWTFAPTVAVARDDRWGRAYESYSEDPGLAGALGAALVEGLQGAVDAEDHLGGGRVIATAKHFFGDGGTDQGVDQGNVTGDLETLKEIHASPYQAAIDAGTGTIMASYNSINGVKMHGNPDLLTGYLRGEMGFDGVVVGDWNGHGQIPGCTVTDCPQAILAGLDIYMVPDDWQDLLETLVAQVKDGTIPEARLDEAVSRVLRLKYRAGLLGETALRPSDRLSAKDPSLLGAPAHRALGREAVAKSQVLLKNEGVLPLDAGATVLVAGTAADSIAQASGGWTLSWQGGGDLTNDDFPGATSVYAGIASAVAAAGGQAILSESGDYADTPDVAVVVFGEHSYAEYAGDKRDLVLRDEEGLALLSRYAADNIPTVAIFISGRPLWMNRELNQADAFLAAWLPGSEGAGVADILFGAATPTGTLSFSWPAHCEGAPVNDPESALFPLGYGLSFEADGAVPLLDETCSVLVQGPTLDWYISGRLGDGVTARADDTDLPGLRGQTERIAARGVDRNTQEDSREITFSPGARLTFEGPGETEAFRLVYLLDEAPTGTVLFRSGKSQHDVTANLAVAARKGWREMVLTQACLPDLTNALTLESEGDLTLRVHTLIREEMSAEAEC